MESPWLNNRFQLDSNIKWLCPECHTGTLSIIKDKFFDEETPDSKAMKKDDYWEFEWITLNFAGSLECKNCENVIMFTGNGVVEHYSYHDHISQEYEEGYHKIFTPTFFQPELNLFKIPDNCPEIISDEIKKSFKLFWFDLASCSNRIRTSIELIMNHFKIIKTSKGSKKVTRLTLHHRIQEFKKKKPEVGEILEAIKWIGNTGSHIGNLETIDILETFQLLELSLRKLFDNKEAELLKISKEINKRKGLRKR